MSFRQSSVTLTSLGVSMPPYDAITNTLSAGDTVETYKFYRYGTSGTHVATWVLTYTSSARSTIVSAVFTDLSA